MITPTNPYNVFPEGMAAGRSDEQTALFYNIMLSLLPPPIGQEIGTYRLMADVGCGYGAGTAMFAQRYPGLWCMGLDVAPDSIVHGTKRYQPHYPNIQYVHRRIEDLGNNVDLVVCSNMLEHYDNPIPQFANLTNAATRMVIVMVPYKEAPLTRYHRVAFDDSGPLPEKFNGFECAHTLTYDCRGTGYWHGDQMVKVYKGVA